MASLEENNKANVVKDEFLIFISQEITSSLNGIVGAINLIKNHEHSSSMKDLVETLDTSVSHLGEFAFKVFLSTQLSSSGYQLKLTEFNLKDMVHYSILDLNDLIQKNNIKVKVEKIADIILRADEDLIFRAFDYILHNAIKYSPVNGIINIKVQTNNDKVTCTFSDNGKGFSHETLNSVFLPFQSKDGYTSQETGLSLYLVKQIIDLHHGEINIFNQKDGGACVELIFRNPSNNLAA
jgi:signal transduction histidine kinase